MPLALARTVDMQALAVMQALVGRSQRADHVAAMAASHLAKLHVVLLGLLVVGGPGAAGWRRRKAAVRIAVALPVTMLAVSVTGHLCQRDRPFARTPDFRPLVDHAPHRSFPSRHSACAAAMTVVALPAAPAVGVLMGLGALGLGLSRVYTGLHYPSDIVAGWLLGGIIGIIARQQGVLRAH